MIAIEDLSVAYGASTVVDSVSLEVATGSWTVLIGANGAGKSSLLRAIVGLVNYAGTVRLFGADARTRQRRELARSIAYVPQRPVLPPAMTVSDYVHLGRTPHLAYFANEGTRDNAVVAEVLERLELVGLAHRRLAEISGGEAQRAVLGRALAQEGSLLVLDEPTTALDLGHQQRVLGLIDELRTERELTVVSSTHDLALAGQFADELVLLAHGAVVATGVARAVLTAENLERHYGASVEIREDAYGRVIVVPLRGPLPRPFAS